jgi:general secretion pathway protein I
MMMRRNGFTLVEVMVALAIFALMAVVLGAAYVNVLNAYARVGQAAQENENLRFARQILFVEPDREKVEEGGDFQTPEGQRVVWRAQIEPTNLPDLFTVTFTCELPSEEVGGKGETVVQTFRLLRPTWSEGSDRDKLRAEAHERITEYQSKLK